MRNFEIEKQLLAKLKTKEVFEEIVKVGKEVYIECLESPITTGIKHTVTLDIYGNVFVMESEPSGMSFYGKSMAVLEFYCDDDPMYQPTQQQVFNSLYDAGIAQDYIKWYQREFPMDTVEYDLQYVYRFDIDIFQDILVVCYVEMTTHITKYIHDKLTKKIALMELYIDYKENFADDKNR